MSLSPTAKRYVADLSERAVATGAGALSAEGIVHYFSLPQAWVPPLAVAVGLAKGVLAKKVGNSATAAVLPAGQDQAQLQAAAHDQATMFVDAAVRLIRRECEGLQAVPAPSVSPVVADSAQPVAAPAVDPVAATYEATTVINPGV